MKKLVMLLFVFVATGVYAQTPTKKETKKERKQRYIEEVNPFRKNGYKPRIITLSNGKYREAFPDTIVQIGSFTYNKRSKRITGVWTTENLGYSEATLRPDLVSRWFSPDPLSDEFPEWSPYNFVKNNPIVYVDPKGLAPQDVIINGENSKEALKQLNSSTSLRLKMDKNGKVTAKGKAKTAADKKLLSAINDKNVVVNVTATSSNFTKDGKWFVGGAFGGSKVNKDGKTVAEQTVNTDHTKTIDEFYGAEKGVSVLHEVLEAYVGAVDSPGIGAPTFADVQKKTPSGVGYLNAHNKVEKIDSRHVAPTISQDPKTGHLYLNKPHPVIPQLNVEKLINNLSKK